MYPYVFMTPHTRYVSMFIIVFDVFVLVQTVNTRSVANDTSCMQKTGRTRVRKTIYFPGC